MPFYVGQDGEFLFEKPEGQKWLLSPQGIETPICTMRPLEPFKSTGRRTICVSWNALARQKYAAGPRVRVSRA